MHNALENLVHTEADLSGFRTGPYRHLQLQYHAHHIVLPFGNFIRHRSDDSTPFPTKNSPWDPDQIYSRIPVVQ